MSDEVYDVGYATGAATAALLNQRHNNGSDPKEITFTIRPDLSQIEKDKDKPNLGKLFPQTGNATDPKFPANNDGFGAPGSNDDAARAERRSRLEGLGAVFGERVVIRGNPPSDAAGDAPVLDPTKGLGNASLVEQINQDLQAQQQELLLAQAAPAIPAGSGIAFPSGGAGALASPLLIPFSVVLIWLAGSQDVADATLDNIPAEQLAQMQALMALAGAQNDTLGGRLVYEQSADGFFQAVSTETREPVIGRGGQILNPELLTALTMGYLGNAEVGDAIPGVIRLPSNVFAVGQTDPASGAYGQAREINRRGNPGDLLVVVDFVLRHGEAAEAAQGFVRGGFPDLVTELLNLVGIGVIPPNTDVNEILRRSGIEVPEALGQLLTTAATSGSPEVFIGRLEDLTTNVLPNVTIHRHENPALPPITIDVTAESVGYEVQRFDGDPEDNRNAVPPDAGPNYGILRFVPPEEFQ